MSDERPKLSLTEFSEQIMSVAAVEIANYGPRYRLLKEYLQENAVVDILIELFEQVYGKHEWKPYDSNDFDKIELEREQFALSISFFRGLVESSEIESFVYVASRSFQSQYSSGFAELYTNVIAPIARFLEKHGTHIFESEESTSTLKVIEGQLNQRLKTLRILLVNPHYHHAREFELKESQLFVITPFDSLYRDVLKPFIQELLESEDLAEHDIQLVDADLASDDIVIEDIWRLVCESQLMICNVSSLNVNVFYELGLAHTLGKRVALLVNEDSIAEKDLKNLPFDTKHIRVIKYSGSDLAEIQAKLPVVLLSQLSQRVAWPLESIALSNETSKG